MLNCFTIETTKLWNLGKKKIR